MRKLINFIFKIPAYIFGRFSWWSPPWLDFLNTRRKESPKAFWLTLLLLLAAGVGYALYTPPPKPQLATSRVQVPPITPNTDQPQPYPLRVSFSLSGTSVSVAELGAMDATLNNDIKMVPQVPGEWKWQSEDTLIFSPEKDWPAGQEYHLTFGENIFSKSVLLESYEASFTTPKFKAQIDSIRFYKDPQNPEIRKVVSVLSFTHPVDTASFEKRLSMYMLPKDDSSKRNATPYKYSVTYDNNKRQAFIHTETVKIEDDETYMYLDVDEGVRPVAGPSETGMELNDRVVIPSTYTFFRVQNASAQIVRDKANNDHPDQALLIEFTDGVKSEDLARHVQVYLLPKKRTPNQHYENYNWRSPSEVTREVLSRATPIELESLPTERDYSMVQSFRFSAPEQRYIYVQIDKGLKSETGFNLTMASPQVVRVPDYPKEAKIAFDGSLISAASEKKLTLVSRGVEALKFEIGQLLPGQINHLVSQTSGDIRNPSFNSRWYFNEENITTLHSEIQHLNFSDPGEAIYSVIDLSKYLRESGQKSGAFFVQVSGWNPKTRQKIYGAADKRLILVTDIGLLVKDSADRTHDVFVQSVRQGAPVSDATVEVLGKNGVAVLSRNTGKDGHVSFPKLDDFKGPMTPVAYLVRKGGDISFIPYNSSPRQLNFSRFDIGGVQTRHQPKEGLNAYLFSDRGIYRPGDTAHLAAIVKQRDWQALGTIPLEIFVRDPRGANVLHKRVELTPSGFIDWELQTDYVSATGAYTASLHLVHSNGQVGNMIGSASFKVEEFQPDRMKIKSNITGKKHRGWYGSEGLKGEVSLENLFGTPAQERTVQAEMGITSTGFSFSEYKGFHFTDPLLEPGKSRINVVEPLKAQKTDADGRVTFDLDIGAYDKGTYRIDFRVEGFEAGGGRSVSTSSSVLVSPVAYLVGYKPDGDLAFIHKGSKRTVNFVAVDPELKQLAVDGITKRVIERRHVSTLVKQRDGTFKYQSILKEVPISSEAFAISEKGAGLILPSDEAGDFVLELVNQAGEKLCRLFYSVAGAGNLTRSLEKNAELKVKLDQKSYDAGQSIEIQITAPYSGAGLITIEREKVYAYKWFRTDKTSALQSIRVPEELEGNAYVNVAFIRAADSKEIFTSPLSYSAVPFSVGREKREIKIDLDTPELVKPGDTLKVNYKTSKPSRIAIIAVDEGILQVAKYQTPDPLSHFLRKQALEVNTFQIVDLILPEYEMMRELAAAGGGDAFARKAIGKNLNPFRRSTDAPVAFWSGILDADQEAREYTIQVPDYFNGSMRLMAVAVSQEAIGTARKDTTVKGPFVISPNAPVVVAPDDEFEVTVGISNNLEGSGERAEIQVALAPSKHLSVVGGASRKVTIAEGSEGKVVFRVRATDSLGSGSMKFTASHGEASSRLTTTLSVRPAVPHMATFESAYESSGSADIEVKRKLLSEYAEQEAAGSHSPLVLVEGLGSYLRNFAHGCAEQMVSKVFPYLGLLNHPGYSVDKQRVREDFGRVIMALRSRQTAGGGFQFWPGQSVTQGIDFPSVYIMHFLTDAKELGYPVPEDVLRRGLDYLLSVARNPSSSPEAARVRAYAIYILTRNQIVTSNYLIDLHKELETRYKREWMNDITSTYMAASFHLLKNRKMQEQVFDGFRFGTEKDYLSSDFDGRLNQDAQYIYLLARHFPEQLEDKVSGESIMAIVKPLNRGEYNTLSASYSMLALGAYTRHFKGAASDTSIRISAVLANDKEAALDVSATPFAKAAFPIDAESISIEADERLFYVISQAGYEKELPKQEIRQGLEIYRDYYNEKGEVITSAPIGSEVTVRVRIRALEDKSATNIAIVDLLPGGFEIIRDSFSSSNASYSWRSYKDIREDRIVIYGDFGPRVSEYRYKAKLTAKGEFVVPSVYARSMYKRHLHARSASDRFTVTGGQ